TAFRPIPFSDLVDGDHTVMVRLVDDAGRPLTPDASDSVTFRIQFAAIVDINPYLSITQIVLAGAIFVVLLYRGPGRNLLATVFLHPHSLRRLTDVDACSLSLTSGAHTIRIQLVADNGTALNPAVSASVRVVATGRPGGGVPRVTILSPTPLESTGHGICVSYRIENFTLVEPRGQPNAPNEGHVQLLVEGYVVMQVAQYDPVLLVSLPEGDITITVRLVNNDNTALTNPDASSSVPIHVVASSAVSLPLVSNGGVALLLAFILVVLIIRRRKVAA